MKKVFNKCKAFLLLIGLTLLSVFGSSQVNIYHSFPDSNATWCLTQIRSDGLNCTGYDFYYYIIGPDSFYNNINYHSIYLTNVTTIGDSICAGATAPVIGLKGLIREDTVLRNVYFVPTGDTLERVLYDFNQSVGDTIPSSQCLVLTVTSVDSILIGMDYRKRINTSAFTSIIEGIGSTQGLLEPQCDGIDYSWDLLGFSHDNISLYPDTSGSCQIPNLVSPIPTLPFTIYFNRESSSITLIFENQSNVMMTFSVFNLLGTKLFEKKIKRENQFITLPQYKPGIYLIEISSSSSTYFYKILL